MYPEPCLGDHAERALAADEELGEVGPGRRTWPGATGAHDPPVGEHDLEPDGHVLDLPVAVGVLARAPAREPAAHRREVHRLGPVPEGEAVSPQRVLDVRAEGARPEVGHQRDVVEFAEPAHPAEVERDPAEERDRGAADPAPTPRGRHRHPGFVAEGEHARDLDGVGGARDERRPRRHLARGGPGDREGPPVPSRFGAGIVGGGHAVADAGQPPLERVVDADPRAVEVFGDDAVDRFDGRDRGGPRHAVADPVPVGVVARVGSSPAPSNACCT